MAEARDDEEGSQESDDPDANAEALPADANAEDTQMDADAEDIQVDTERHAEASPPRLGRGKGKGLFGQHPEIPSPSEVGRRLVLEDFLPSEDTHTALEIAGAMLDQCNVTPLLADVSTEDLSLHVADLCIKVSYALLLCLCFGASRD